MKRGRLIAMLALALAGCSFDGSDGGGSPDGGGGGTGDGNGGGDSGGGTAITPRCKFTLVDLCTFTPKPALSFGNSTIIDTSVDASCDAIVPQGSERPELCVKYAESIAIANGAIVRGIGSRPLVLAANKGAIAVSGTLTVSSYRQSGSITESVGAGGAGMDCEDFPDSPDSAASGGGGGAGGGFSGKGGNGGIGAGSNNGGRSPAPIPFNEAKFLRGGCRGQAGGDSGGSANGGAPGSSGPAGGALYLAAAGEITIATTGAISANGGGGRGGGAITGGGGGGSGGMIVIEGAAIHRLGPVIANGGAGGEGGVFLSPVQLSGESGDDGLMSGSAARGGNNMLTGHGGNGNDVASRNGVGGQPGAQGGGGGGGAAGFIRFLGPSDGAGVLSPPLSN